jgi:Mn2+/Fe2+ NRAMP family transporter
MAPIKIYRWSRYQEAKQNTRVLKDFFLSIRESKLNSRRLATLAVISLAAAVFLVQRLAGPFLDLAFEICIFYIPALTIVNLFLYIRKKIK